VTGIHDNRADAIELQVPVEQFRSVPITMYYLEGRGTPDEQLLEAISPAGTGTGFFYRLHDRLYLVTARHCFSARNWETGKFLPGSHSVEPTHVTFPIRKCPPGGKWDLSEPAAEATLCCLRLLDKTGKATWFEHPRAGAGMDVAVLPLPDEVAADESLLIEAYGPAPSDGNAPKLAATVAQDVFVVGYPYGLDSGFMLPLWIRGAIASEPAMYYPHRGQDLPLLLVDARTRKGQSGSPAILYRQPLSPIFTNNGDIRMTQGGVSRVLGVYSGRISRKSDLGLVWRIEEVDVICRAAKRARLDYRWPLSPFQPMA